MLRKLLKRLLTLAITTLFSLGTLAATQVPPALAQSAAGKLAFPTAEGFGANAKGGRGV